jgi:hypothetical protein
MREYGCLCQVVEVVSDSSRGSESEIEEAQLITILEEDNGTLVPITW